MSTTASVVVLVVIIGAVAASVAILNHAGSSNSSSSTSITTETSSISSLPTSRCTQLGVGNIGLTVIDSSTQAPVSGLSVAVNEVTGECVPPQLDLGAFTTDANGTVMATGEGAFTFSVKYGGEVYNATGELAPMGLTCLTLYVPSGIVTNRSTTLSNSAYYCSNSAFATSTSSRTNTTSTTTSTGLEQPFPNVEKTLDFDHIPYNFTLGNFTVTMVYNGTDYEPPTINGTMTQNLGFVWAFNVTTPDGVTKNVYFPWQQPLGPCISNESSGCIPRNQWILPNPENAAVQYSANFANLYIAWMLNSTNLYISFTQWEQVPVIGPTPTVYVPGSCPSDNETYPNTMTPWSAPTSNITVYITNLTVDWLGPASGLSGETGQPSQNLSLNGGQILFLNSPFSGGEPFDYNVDSVYTNTTEFSVLGICAYGRVVTLPQEVLEGTNFSFEILLQLPTNSSYVGPVEIYIQTGQETPGCGNCNGTAS